MGVSIGDEIAGLYAAFGTLTALRARDRFGVGEHVDVSLVEALFSLSEGLLPEFVHCGQVTERSGNRYLRAAPSGIFETRDGKYLCLAANSDPIFRRFSVVLKKTRTFRRPAVRHQQGTCRQHRAFGRYYRSVGGGHQLGRRP